MSNITSISPTGGVLVGGNTVVITGTGFASITSVTFAAYVAAFTVDSDTQITATAPDASDSTGGPVLIFLDGVSDPEFDGVYTYAGPGGGGGGEPCITVEVPTLLADGSTADGDGIVYTVEAVDGWYDSIPMRSALLEAQPRGETIVVAHEGGRTIDVKITAHSAVAGEALGAILCFTAMYTIKTAFRAVFVPISFRVVDAYADRTLLARRIGPIKESILGNSAAVTFSIPMLGEDPRRFAT